jgi:site-specific recombinase XerC
MAAAGEALHRGDAGMTQLAPHLTAFLREHLPRERRASVHTCDAYAYSFQLLVTFAAQTIGHATLPATDRGYRRANDPCLPRNMSRKLRGNKARSRNARLAAVKSFFRYLEHRVPAVLDQALRVHCHSDEED